MAHRTHSKPSAKIGSTVFTTKFAVIGRGWLADIAINGGPDATADAPCGIGDHRIIVRYADIAHPDPAGSRRVMRVHGRGGREAKRVFVQHHFATAVAACRSPRMMPPLWYASWGTIREFDRYLPRSWGTRWGLRRGDATAR